MELLCVVIFAIIVALICVVVIKASFLEAEAEKYVVTLFFLRNEVENPTVLLNQLSSAYSGKIIVVNVDGKDEDCAVCRAITEHNSHIVYSELNDMKSTILNEYLKR